MLGFGLRPGCRLFPGRRELIDDHARAIRKLRDQFQFAAHCLYVAAECREQHIAAPLDPRDGVLSDAQAHRKLFLRSLARRSIFARRLIGIVASTWLRVLAMMVLLSLLCEWLQGCNVFVESSIRGRDQAFVKTLLIDPT